MMVEEQGRKRSIQDDESRKKQAQDKGPDTPQAESKKHGHPCIVVVIEGRKRLVHMVGARETAQVDPTTNACAWLDLTKIRIPTEPGARKTYTEEQVRLLTQLWQKVAAFKEELRRSPDLEGLIFCEKGLERTPTAAAMLMRQCSDQELGAGSLVNELQELYDAASRMWDAKFKQRVLHCLGWQAS